MGPPLQLSIKVRFTSSHRASCRGDCGSQVMADSLQGCRGSQSGHLQCCRPDHSVVRGGWHAGEAEPAPPSAAQMRVAAATALGAAAVKVPTAMPGEGRINCPPALRPCEGAANSAGWHAGGCSSWRHPRLNLHSPL